MSNTTNSPSFTTVPFSKVQIYDSFWAPRLKVNREETLEAQYQQLVSTGRIDALRLTWEKGEENVPHIFWESDIAKWIEAAAYSLSSHPDEHLAKRVDEVIDLLEGAQQPDGYLNVHFTVVEPDRRWENLRDDHELYCAGHLIEAAVAHKQAVGSTRLLEVMERYAQYINKVFGTRTGQLRGYCGHEEIELALVKLAAITGNSEYLDLAEYFVDERGKKPCYFDQEARDRGEDPSSYWAKSYAYCQADTPVRELAKVAGHSVRAMYLYSAMADLARINNDQGLKSACERLWHHLVDANIYITGGIGSSRHNEGFTKDYDLPNESAYAETCAAIGLVFWAHRMLQLDNDSSYADIMERALYNGVISGVSLDGNKFLYENPLESSGSFHRQDWFECACCPPNLARLLASLSGYIYGQSESGIAVHLYVQGSAEISIAGANVKIEQETNYPWNGAVTLRISIENPAEFDLCLRLPSWNRVYSISVNQEKIDPAVVRGYAVINQMWKTGDVVNLNMEMPVELIQAHPKVVADAGRIAIQRGPVVYCLEDVDNDVHVCNVSVDRNTRISTEYRPDLLNGIVTIELEGYVLSEDNWGEALYRPLEKTKRKIKLKAVPYSVWDNRSPGEMVVWTPVN
jgi:DUF1680 family protein